MKTAFVVGEGRIALEATTQFRDEIQAWIIRLIEAAQQQAPGITTAKGSARIAGELYAYKNVVSILESINIQT